jgi:hypothetical protein
MRELGTVPDARLAALRPVKAAPPPENDAADKLLIPVRFVKVTVLAVSVPRMVAVPMLI